MPRYSSLTINAGASIVPLEWSDGFGRFGGIVAIEVSGTTTINGKIDANGAGFRGGAPDNISTNFPAAVPNYASNLEAYGGAKGESVAGSTTFTGTGTTLSITGTLPGGAVFGRGAAANGGGGGNAHNAGGGGGANATNSNTWKGQGVMRIRTDNTTNTTNDNLAWKLDPGYTANNNTLTNNAGGGRGGYSYSQNNQDPTTTGPGNTAWGGDNRQERGGLGGRPLAITAQSRIFLGGGGGAGDANDSKGKAGGNGGGLIYLLTNTLAGAGTIEANGVDAPDPDPATSNLDAPGGGGGGGTIIVKAAGQTGVVLSANGGKGGNNQISITTTTSGETEGPGGGGGGYIAFSGGTPTMHTLGGLNGITNNPVHTKFPANGATSGASGQTLDITSTAMPVPTADLKITQAVTAGPYAAGQQITITLTATNTGPDIGNNIVVTDLLPAGLTFVSSSSTNYVASTGKWNVGNLAAGGTATLSITATVQANTGNTANFYTNTAEVVGYEYDPNVADNKATVTLSPVNQPPVITSNGGGETAAILIPENTTAVTTVTSTDPENNTRTYSITGGADAARFSINPTTGALTFISAPDFENPADADLNNTYIVRIRATDNGTGALFDEQTITVSVTNINEAPVANDRINSTPLSSSAGSTRLDPLTGSDPEGSSLPFFQIKTLPASSQGMLYIGTTLAEANKDYTWSQAGNLFFDPAYGNTANATFTYTVKDNEGAVDATPATYTIPIILDFDLDGIADADDLDDDNDGIPDATEGNGDKDGDGIINLFDLDADGDGITDVLEAHSGVAPGNYDPTTGRLTGAVGANGIPDSVETSADSGTLNYTIPDTDGDGLKDFLDIDSDNDGIADNVEAQGSVRVQKAGADADRDGIDDSYDPTCGCSTAGTALVPVDTDGDSMPDYLDTDSDNDTYSDLEEAFDIDKDGKSINDLLKLASEFTATAGTSEAAAFYPPAENESTPPAWLEFSNRVQRQLNFVTAGNTHYHDSDNDGLVDLFDQNSFQASFSPNPAFRDASVATPLPVTLLSFTARLQQQGVLLAWTTVTELNNDRFLIERSHDGNVFEEIGMVRGAGTSNQKRNYTFPDAQATAGTLYYRLRQVDYDGKHENSPVVSVTVQHAIPVLLQLYPNPATDFACLDMTMLPVGTYTVRIISMNGSTVQEHILHNEVKQKLDVRSLSPGKYIIRIQGEDTVQAINLIKR